jgi:hypothetical protein
MVVHGQSSTLYPAKWTNLDDLRVLTPRLWQPAIA